MNNRTLRIAVILSAFALIGVAGVGAVAAQGITTTAEAPTNPTTQDTVTVDVTVSNPGSAAHSYEINASALDGSTPTSANNVTVSVAAGGTATETLTIGSLGTGTYRLVANATNTTSSNGYTTTVNASYTVSGAPNQRVINDGDTIFIDERDIDTNAGVFAGTSTGAFAQDGTPLNIDNGVVQDQSTGAYTDGTNTINVQEPEIEDIRVIDLNTDERLSQGDERVETSSSENVQIVVRYNFDDSSFIDFSVNEDGLEVTSRYHNGNLGGDAYDEGRGTGVPAADGKNYDAAFNLTMDDSGQFEIEAAAEDEVNAAGDAPGNRDVGFDDGVSQTLVLEMVDEDDIALNLDQGDAFQGENVQYDVEGLNEGERSALILEGDDLRDQTPAGLVQFGNQVFDPVADGTTNGHIVQAQVPGILGGSAGDYYVYDPSGSAVSAPGDNIGRINAAGSGYAATGSLPASTVEALLDNGDITVEYVFGVVERDGTSVSQLETKYLDDTGVDIEAFDSVDAAPFDENAVLDIFTQDAGGNTVIAEEEDEESLNAEEAEITIDSPPRTYVPGQDVDLNGTTSDGVDEVSVFVRDRDKYFLVENISVDNANDEYEETDFELSGTDSVTFDAADILGKPGVYRYGVIDTFDAEIANREAGSDTVFGQTTDTTPPTFSVDTDSNNGLESSAFNSASSTQRSIRVSEPSLDAEFLTYDGEIFRPDGIDYEGELIGPREYVVLFTGSRGNTFGERDQADRDGEIEEDFDLSDVRSGNVQAAILSPGRDEVFGDGVFNTPQSAGGNNLDATPSNLISLLQTGDNTQTQARELLLAETVEEAASDDLISADQFRLSTDSRTQIEDITAASIADNVTGITDVEVGETMVIRGTTNRNPDDATVVVEAVEGPSTAELGTAVTDEWETDGVWSVEIEIPEEVEPGNYTIQSDDGERVDEASVNIVAEGTFSEGERLQDQVGELRERIEELEGQVDQLESERDDLESQVSDLESENSDLEAQLEDAQSEEPEGNESDGGDEESEGQPGFTAVAALVALMAVALLALRREEE